MKKNKILFLYLLLSFSLVLTGFSDALSAEGKKTSASHMKVGYVDLSTLLAFHPYMQYFSFESNVFIRPIKEKTDKSDLLKQIRDRQEKYKIFRETKDAEMKRLQEDVSTVENEINKLRVKLSREQTLLNQKYSDEYTKLSAEKEKKERTEIYHRELSKLEQEYYNDKKIYEQQKSKISEQMNEIMQKLLEVDYLSRKDGEDFFNGIVAEINSALKEVADEKKIPVVLNSNFISVFSSSNFAAPGNYDEQNSAVRLETLPMANYTSIIDNLEQLEAASATSEIEAGSAALSSYCNTFFGRRKEIVRLFYKSGILNQMVLVGGEDLTLETLERIFAKHSIPKIRSEKIIRAVGSLLYKMPENLK
ncbi:MAG TPA: hypothetical protein PKK26_15590 [Candidatus Wallbacteria bacterium]|nr:hypothetical protein [Candidatus Wallbacteria bacterium]